MDALGVAQVPEHLLDAPLPRRWGRGGCLVGNPRQQLLVLCKLLGEEIEDWSFGNAGNVVFVVLSVFGRSRDG